MPIQAIPQSNAADLRSTDKNDPLEDFLGQLRKSSAPELVLEKCYSSEIGRSTDEWLSRFYGHKALHIEALGLMKEKLLLRRERMDVRKNRKSWRERDNMTAVARAEYQAECDKIDAAFKKREDALEIKRSKLEERLIDERIEEEKTRKSLVIDLSGLVKSTQKDEKPPKKPPKEYREAGATRRAQYADPKGWKYPIDTEMHVRAAISYFSKPKNAAMYSVDKQKQIWGRIKAAAKRFKIELGEKSGPPSVEKSLTQVKDLDDWLEKAGPKKYVKRTGTPGHYKYEYADKPRKPSKLPVSPALEAETKRLIEAAGRKVTRAGKQAQQKIEQIGRSSAKFKAQRDKFHIHAEAASATQHRGEKLFHMVHAVTAAKEAMDSASKAGKSDQAKIWQQNYKLRSRVVADMRNEGVKEKTPTGWLNDGTERGSSSQGEKIKKSVTYSRRTRFPTHTLTPANQREFTAHADAVYRSKIAMGEPDVVIEDGYPSVLAKSSAGMLMRQSDSAPLSKPVPLAYQQVLCKSVFQGGCDGHFPAALSACPDCGAGTIESRGLPSYSEIGVHISSDPRGLRAPRRVPDVKIEDY